MNKRAKETDIICIRSNKLESPYLKELGAKIVNLYPVDEDTIIPEEALDPEIWDIPEGYYAIEVKNVD